MIKTDKKSPVLRSSVANPPKSSGISTRYSQIVENFQKRAEATRSASPVHVPVSVGASIDNRAGQYRAPYHAASQGRRTFNWTPTRLGPGTLYSMAQMTVVARSRDQVRNNPLAVSAIDNFESQHIGTGIVPKWNIADDVLRDKIHAEFKTWAEENDFYAMQALMSREVFEAGEVFIKYLLLPAKYRRRVPLKLQLIESEQVPIYGQSKPAGKNTIKAGIELDSYDERVAYHVLPEHPGESLGNRATSGATERISADDILHVFKPLRAGALRGEPRLTGVLTLLNELDKYSDAELGRKVAQAMFTFWVTKSAPDVDVMPVADRGKGTSIIPSVETDLETGTVIELNPGESVIFPAIALDATFAMFMKVQMHKFAAAIGASHEQITGDLEGVNLSSIRAGLLDVRRKVTQFQKNVFIKNLHKIAVRWLNEAILAGVIPVPQGYEQDARPFQDITWTPQGFGFVDPQVEVATALDSIQGGLTSRSRVIVGMGGDPLVTDAENQADHQREDKMGLKYTNPTSKVEDWSETDANGNPIPGGKKPTTAPADTSKPSSVKKKAISLVPYLGEAPDTAIDNLG